MKRKYDIYVMPESTNRKEYSYLCSTNTNKNINKNIDFPFPKISGVKWQWRWLKSTKHGHYFYTSPSCYKICVKFDKWVK